MLKDPLGSTLRVYRQLVNFSSTPADSAPSRHVTLGLPAESDSTDGTDKRSKTHRLITSSEALTMRDGSDDWMEHQVKFCTSHLTSKGAFEASFEFTSSCAGFCLSSSYRCQQRIEADMETESEGQCFVFCHVKSTGQTVQCQSRLTELEKPFIIFRCLSFRSFLVEYLTVYRGMLFCS